MANDFKQKDLFSRYELHYAPLIEEFCNRIKDLQYDGMPEPHIPIIGSDYWRAKYKIAIYGIDTAYWFDLCDFVEKGLMDPSSAVRMHQDVLDKQDCLGWTNNFHSSFWDFIFTFLSSLYKVDVDDIRAGKHPELVRSIIYGNTNSIERYGIQAEDNEVDPDVYVKIKEASRIFDSGHHMIDIAKPNVVLVLNWGEGDEWFIDERINIHYYNLNDHIRYFYNRKTGTHIFQSHHPRSLYVNFGFESFLQEELLRYFRQFNIWDNLPDSPDEAFLTESELLPSNNTRRNLLIADIANGLIRTHSVMWGQQLVDILNRNNIMTNHGTSYAYNSRGIYKTISAAWHYYNDILHDEQTAYNIAMSFVNEKGDYAYE